MRSAEQKEYEWKQKRMGKITASVLPDLMTKGRGKEELFGAKAFAAMYIIRYERRTKTIRESITGKALDWGNENEPLAVEWMREQMPFCKIRSCSNDFEHIVFNQPFTGFGDSPDYYVYDKTGKISAVGEIKCPASQAKIEELQFLDAITEGTEYYYQFLGHFIGTPEVDTLYYTIFDGFQNTGKVIEMKRADHEENIQRVTDRIKLVNEVIDVSLRSGREFKDCIEKAKEIVKLREDLSGFAGKPLTTLSHFQISKTRNKLNKLIYSN